MNRDPGLVRVITHLPVGGIERRLVAVLPRLAAKGWRASVIVIRERGALADELEASGIPIRVMPFMSRFSPPRLREMAAYLRENKTDVLHSHMYRSNAPAAVAGHMAKTPAVFAQIHNVGTWETSRQAFVDRWLCRYRTGIIAVSKAVQRDVIARLRVPESKVPVLYNGIDTDAFQPDPKARERVRGEIGLRADVRMVLVPARLHPNKNVLGMLAAFQRVIHGGYTGKARLVFAGAGPMEKDLRKAITEGGLAHEVILLGERNDMPALYNAADLVALPSFKEGFSNAVIEALGCGKPVLATDVGGNAEAIVAPAHGWIVPPGDAPALETALAAAFREGDALATRAPACRARAMDFSLDALVENTHRLYCGALGIEP